MIAEAKKDASIMETPGRAKKLLVHKRFTEDLQSTGFFRNVSAKPEMMGSLMAQSLKRDKRNRERQTTVGHGAPGVLCIGRF